MPDCRPPGPPRATTLSSASPKSCENVFLHLMNEVSRTTSHEPKEPALTAETLGKKTAVAEGPGLWSVRVPFPDNPLGYTIVYALETSQGPVLVDAGWDDPDSLAALEAGLTDIGSSVAEVRGVLVTHHHPDHHGLAGRIREASGCWVGMHAADAAVVNMVRTMARGPWTNRYRRLLELCGAPQEALDSAEATVMSGTKPAEPDLLIEDRQLIDVPGRAVLAIWTPGHSPGHTCLHLEDTREL